jgi:hypothetical protein
VGKWLDMLLDAELASEKCRTTQKKNTDKRGEAEPSKPHKPAKRYAYRFRLHDNGGGGTVLTDEPDLDKARASLAARYGTRLAMVVEA